MDNCSDDDSMACEVEECERCGMPYEYCECEH